MSKRKKIIFAIWIALAISSFVLYLIFPSWFTVDNLKSMLSAAQGHILTVYIIVSLLRGVFFIPSTPFVLVGAMLFPEMHLWVFLISLAGVVAGGSYIFFFTEYLDIDKFLKAKNAARYERLKSAMEKYGIWVVAGWSFFPIVPTDLISYAAGATRMPYWKYLLGLLLGEAPLVALYVFTGKSIGAFLFG